MHPHTNMIWKSRLVSCLLLAIAMSFTGCATREKVSREAHASLNQLVNRSPAAAALASRAKGILVFPDVLKGGFIFAGTQGEGALIQGGETTGYYNVSGISYGFLAGVQIYSYALFFMSDADLAYLHRSEGFELGGGVSLVAAKAGVASSLTTTTVAKGVHSFFYDQQGLMGAIDVQGAKITRKSP